MYRQLKGYCIKERMKHSWHCDISIVWYRVLGTVFAIKFNELYIKQTKVWKMLKSQLTNLLFLGQRTFSEYYLSPKEGGKIFFFSSFFHNLIFTSQSFTLITTLTYLFLNFQHEYRSFIIFSPIRIL